MTGTDLSQEQLQSEKLILLQKLCLVGSSQHLINIIDKYYTQAELIPKLILKILCNLLQRNQACNKYGSYNV